MNVTIKKKDFVHSKMRGGACVYVWKNTFLTSSSARSTVDVDTRNEHEVRGIKERTLPPRGEGSKSATVSPNATDAQKDERKN